MGNNKGFIKEIKRGPKMKKMVILIAFCSLTLAGCASYSFYSRSCQNLDNILVDININRIDPIIDSMDELFLSTMKSTSKHFSKWEE
jgi:hypothetical protein